MQKTKIVIFRKGVRIREHNFMYSNNEIEIVNSFVYLGILLAFNGKWNMSLKRLSNQGTKSLFNLYNIVKETFLPVKESLALFDSLIRYLSYFIIWIRNLGFL